MSKSEPEVRELSEFLNEFNKESDRGAVLVAASVLDERLSEILKAFFVDVPTSEELLQGYNAPLGTFASRVSTAYSLGLIQENEYKEINIIRKIRNEFGHNWKDIDFKNQQVFQLCIQLPWLGPDDIRDDTNMRQRFDFALIGLLTDLLWRVRLVRKEKRRPKVWPNKSRPS